MCNIAPRVPGHALLLYPSSPGRLFDRPQGRPIVTSVPEASERARQREREREREREGDFLVLGVTLHSKGNLSVLHDSIDFPDCLDRQRALNRKGGGGGKKKSTIHEKRLNAGYLSDIPCQDVKLLNAEVPIRNSTSRCQIAECLSLIHI